MEIVYISAEDLSQQDTNLNNIISINSNHYWDTEEEPSEQPEYFYA